MITHSPCGFGSIDAKKKPTTASTNDLLPWFPHKAEYDLCEKKGERGMSKSRHTEAQMIGALKQVEQGTQAPSLAPRAPPSRLKPEMEANKFIVFLRERKQGAGHQRLAYYMKRTTS